MELSIIIPHINDQENLKKCLKSIADQRGVFSSFEVIVCDNGSDELDINSAEYNFDLLIVVEPIRGAAAARNAGLKVAKGTFLAFTDCDCLLDPHFIAKGLQHLKEKPSNHVMLGDVIIYPEKMPPNGVEAFEMIFLMNQEMCARQKDGATGNLWTTRSLMDQIGGFQQNVAEDTDWCKRAALSGADFSFNGACIVHHPARKTLNELRAKWIRQTAMKFNEIRGTKLFFLKWLMLSIIVFISPFVHSVKALQSTRLSKLQYRSKALPVLFWCRWFRTQLMLKLLLQPNEIIDPTNFWRKK